MKMTWLKSGMLALAVTVCGWTAKAESSTFNVQNEVAKKRYMTSTVTIDSSGMLNGKTILKNKNRFLGFTGGVFVVALDDQNNALYSTPLHKYGLNACFFRKSRTRTVTWTDQIPEEYLPKVAKIAIVQQHAPTYRVWKWIYNNKDLLIAHAKYVKNLYEDIKNGEFDVNDGIELIEAHLSR